MPGESQNTESPLLVGETPTTVLPSMTTTDLLIQADRSAYSASCLLTQAGERESISESKAREVLEHLRSATAAMQTIVNHFGGETTPSLVADIKQGIKNESKTS